MDKANSNTTRGRPARVPSAEELPALHERTPLAVVDEAFVFLRINLPLLLGVSLVIMLPPRLIAGALPGSALRDARPDQLADALFAQLDNPDQVLAAIGLLAADSVSLYAIAVVYGRLAAEWFSSRASSASDVLVWAVRRSPLMLLLWLTAHVVQVAGGFFSFGLAGLFVGILFMLSAPVAGAESPRWFGALGRSVSLVTSNLGRSIAVFVVVAVAGQVIRLMLRALPTILSIDQLPLPTWVISGVFDVLATTVVLSFTAASSLVLYLDCRVRREGIDLDMAITRVFPGASGNSGVIS